MARTIKTLATNLTHIPDGKLKIFISWSGPRSKALAIALADWLPMVFQDVVPWVSAHDIHPGERWAGEVAKQLNQASLGILCLTPENLDAPWILFEAGALSKVVDFARVIPYRLNLKATDITWPLAQFQSEAADREGTFRLVKSINDVYEKRLPIERITKSFTALWGELDNDISSIEMESLTQSDPRSERELLEEILSEVRRRPELGGRRDTRYQIRGSAFPPNVKVTYLSGELFLGEIRLLDTASLMLTHASDDQKQFFGRIKTPFVSSPILAVEAKKPLNTFVFVVKNGERLAISIQNFENIQFDPVFNAEIKGSLEDGTESDLFANLPCGSDSFYDFGTVDEKDDN